MSIIQHYIYIHSVYKYKNRFKSVDGINGAINITRQNKIKSEIIGQWLYCFSTDLIGVQLISIGFWYSKKHCAFVYTGNPKEGLADGESLNEIRARLGCQKV